MDYILDDDLDIPITSQFNQNGEEDDMLRTPSPNVKRPKFDLSELDEKQKPMIPEPQPEPLVELVVESVVESDKV